MLNIQKIINKPLNFEEAIEYFKEKIPVTSGEFYSIKEDYKTKAFTVSGYTSLEILKKFKDELVKALKDGITSGEFKNRMNDFLARKGYEGITPYQADNIFRTNIQTAYNVGHYKQMTKPETLKARPYWIYDAVNDRRSRPTHLAMDGKVYPADHEIWDTWYPPNGYRCRCSVSTLSKRQVELKGLKIETEIPVMVEPKGGVLRNLIPDKGFETNPAKTVFEPELSKYPMALEKAYKKRMDKSL
ncbi:phage head morphogenesis protein [Maledivibacter halophilus]|uniref:Phage putative head morphogenesis protein, SPP1 gp7 family n=1 Tax=Maledivibacter halophilus TaxID=36842 RepID=A0A1T5LW18_9FIRM|nr:phage minor head protein [Maledivibacter halophilus]SKC68372.1 phage putative head morphogenesis protein, SPP1 gp7 family [Maledivibacter halophilus]SKC71696.1 phage putative head morphogenesis protein, SPP1 gp7 family [Maledivibacter halophilus]SKC80200.1 phage putative head morphogenesis protein, SPP1 gp7 family [Maledivibacter halophilus]